MPQNKRRWVFFIPAMVLVHHLPFNPSARNQNWLGKCQSMNISNISWNKKIPRLLMHSKRKPPIPPPPATITFHQQEPQRLSGVASPWDQRHNNLWHSRQQPSTESTFHSTECLSRACLSPKHFPAQLPCREAHFEEAAGPTAPGHKDHFLTFLQLSELSPHSSNPTSSRFSVLAFKSYLEDRKSQIVTLSFP